MFTQHDKWFLLFLAFSLCAGFLGYCHKEARGEDRGRRLRTYHPSIPYYQQYKAEMYRNKTYWLGFDDPVPRLGTSKWIDDWNYRIIRQKERQRIRQELKPQPKRFRNYFRRRR